VRRWNSLTLFVAVAMGMLALLLGVSFASRLPDPAREERSQEKFALLLRPVLAFALLAFLYVGVEACVSGWMMSYVHRLSAMRYAVPPIATSGFWISLVCGRAAAPFALRRISESNVMAVSMAGAFLGIVSLLLSHDPASVVGSAAVAGFMLGPIYPLCLAKVLGLMRDSPRSKWVFATAGLGGAFLPFLTGKLATRTGSLTVGLTVPLFGLLVMLAALMAAAERREVPAPLQS
jgi:FHS family glucose/mannose:H+ symporter-like MFS transporter